MTRICILQGHPDPSPDRYGRALAGAYARGALGAGHEVRRIDVASRNFPLLRGARDFYAGAPPDDIADAQADLRWADHWLILFPLWQGNLPALLHGFLEQVFRPGFAVEIDGGALPRKKLKGTSAHVVVTMGMPWWFYRLVYGARALKVLEENLLRFSGVGPVRTTLVGSVGAGVDTGPAAKDYPALANTARLERWLERLEDLGRQGR